MSLVSTRASTGATSPATSPEPSLIGAPVRALNFAFVLLLLALVAAACTGGWAEVDEAAAAGGELADGVVTDPAEMEVAIGGWKPAGSANEEFIDIENRGSAAVSLEGWTLSNSGDEPYEFGPDAIVEPGEAARLFVRCSPDQPDSGQFFWCLEADQAWGDGAGEAILIDPNGTVADEDSYRA